MRLDVRVTRSAAQTTVSVAGELDYASAPDLLREPHPLFEIDAPPIVAVLDGIKFIDTSGLGALVWAHKRAESVGTTFQIAAQSTILSRRLASELIWHVPGRDGRCPVMITAGLLLVETTGLEPVTPALLKHGSDPDLC